MLEKVLNTLTVHSIISCLKMETLHHHQIMLQKALEIYKQWNIEPFHVIDIEIFYYDNDETKEIRCLCFYRIFGDFENKEVGENVDSIQKDLVPYMLIASGIGFSSPFLNFDPKSLYALYESRRDERREWLKTHTVTLDKIANIAEEHLNLSTLQRTRDKMDRENKWTLKKHYNRRAYRWEPYLSRVLAHDPKQPPLIAMSVEKDA